MTAMTDDTLPVTPRTIRDEMIAFGIMTALLLIVPFTGVYPFFVMQALCFALLACAFNLLIGYGGLLSFGHAMFLGTAGYITAHALKVWGLPPELGIVEGLTKVFFPEASNTVIFVIMIIVLLIRPAGLFGRSA